MSDPSPPSTVADANTTVPIPFATSGHLYLLVAGILLGVVFGPGVLGRLAPATYDAWFVGGGEEARQLAREEAAITQQLALLEGVGVTQVAADELVARETERLAPLRVRVQTARAERDQAVRGWLGAIVAALVLLAVVEPLLTPEVRQGGRAVVPRTLSGVVTARYALLALCIAIAIAKPSVLAALPWLLVILLAMVALAAGLTPLGRRGQSRMRQP